MKDESTDICDQIKIAIFKQKYCKARNAKHTSFVVLIIYLLIIVIIICIIGVKINKMSENKTRVINELIYVKIQNICVGNDILFTCKCQKPVSVEFYYSFDCTAHVFDLVKIFQYMENKMYTKLNMTVNYQ